MERVLNIIENDNGRSETSIGMELGISNVLVHRILTEDLNKSWKITKWVPLTLQDSHETIRVERLTDMLDAFRSRILVKNLITIDNKWFYARHLKPRHTIGIWISPGGDATQTARRTTMEQKFMIIIAISQRVIQFFKVLPRNLSINS